MPESTRREFLSHAALGVSAGLSTAAPVPAVRQEEITLKDLPEWKHDKYRADAVLSCTIMLQKTGREKGMEKLKKELVSIEKAVQEHTDRFKAAGLTGERLELAVKREAYREFQKRNGIILLCRMLFTAKDGKVFRRPAVGAPHFVGVYHATSWPLEPIEIIDGVPFLIVRGYTVGGLPESAEDYLEDCIKDCQWNPVKFVPRTAVEKQNALSKLIGFLRHAGEVRNEDVEFLRAQIK